jgi:hypothetical protein
VAGCPTCCRRMTKSSVDVGKFGHMHVLQAPKVILSDCYVLMTRHMVRIGNWIYWTFANYK